jgi:two-component system response regulator NreC
MNGSMRVVLADDHQVFLQGLSTLLESQGVEVAGQTTDRDELLDMVERERPDVVVVDVSMPGVAVQQMMALLREKEIDTAVLILTGSDEPDCALDMLAAGAQGYVLKEHAFEDILAAIQAVGSGKKFVSPQIASEVLTRHDHEPATTLTGRQLEILRLIAKGLTSKRIASQLGIHLKTVDNHRQRLREKLGVHSSTELIHVATERGLI